MASDLCDLCGLTLRYGVSTYRANGKTYRFCCMGCRQVFTMLLEASETDDPSRFRDTDLFRQCVAAGVIPASEEDLRRRTAGGDAFRKKPADGGRPEAQEAAAEPGEMLALHLEVSGMWCPACAWVIAHSLNRKDGIGDAVCDFSTDSVRLRYDPVKTAPDRVMAAIRRLGYRAARSGQRDRGRERRSAFVRFGISAFLTMNVMMLSFALYSGFFTRLTPDTVASLSWPIFAMASIVFVYGGWPIHQKAWAGIVAGAPGMEALICIGSASAYFYSTSRLFAGSIHLYYDTAAMLITLVLLGKLIERRAKDAVQEELGSFFDLQPKKVRICTERWPRGRFADVGQIAVGDTFRVDEDEVVPVDGTIRSGAGSVDESAITGEPLPVAKQSGDRLISGTRVVSGSFRATARAVGQDATLGRMIAVMREALGQKAPVEGKTDRVLRWFVPGVVALAAGTGLVCHISGMGAADAMIRAITVLVISCPCALGIAIPLARVAGIALAGKQGVLVRSFAAFEQTDRIGAVVFDKTGTLTCGRWQLLHVSPQAPHTERQALALAAGLERTADHPVAVAIRQRAEQQGIPAATVERICDRGSGVDGMWNGRTLAIGAADDSATAVPGGSVPSVPDAVVSDIALRVDGRPAARFVFGDRIKSGAGRAIRALKAGGHRIVLLSGDSMAATRAVARQLAITECFGGRSPLQKAAYLRDLQRDGHVVAMVGDGINDAPALAQADLAAAVHTGDHLGKAASGITLMRGEPEQLPAFMGLARAVNRKIFQNLWCALIYNVIAIPIAMAGWLTPLVAVCAMLLSSLTVTGNTLLLFRGHRPVSRTAAPQDSDRTPAVSGTDT